MSTFEKRVEMVDELLLKAKDVGKGKSLAETKIDVSWMRAYGQIARRCRADKDFGLTRYPYEQGPSVGAFTGGFFEHREWTPRKAMDKHQSMQPVTEYEANYTNAAGYWMAFHESAISLSQESIAAKKDEKALQFDVWALIAIRYGLRVVGLRSEFYKLSGRDPTYAKLVMPSLEQRNDVSAADDLTEPMYKLDTHSVQEKGAPPRRSNAHGPRRSLWQATQKQVEEWCRLGCSDYLCRAIQFGIFEEPSTPFQPGQGEDLGDIPQSEEDKSFAAIDLEEGCRSGIYREITNTARIASSFSGVDNLVGRHS